MKLYRGEGENKTREDVGGLYYSTSINVAKAFAGEDGDVVELEYKPISPKIIDYGNDAKSGKCDWIQYIINDDAILENDCLIINNIVEDIEEFSEFENESSTSVLIFKD